jgi:Fe-S-cluster containining protein
MGDQAHEAPIVTLGVELVSPGWKLKTTIGVPAGRTPLPQVLPLAHALADAVTRMAEQSLEQQGEKITCRKGCAACCRTMIPIAEVEAHGLRDLVDRLPEPRRTRIRERFADALRRLEQTGRLARLRARARWKDADHRENQVEYFRLGIACPFLENEACSIYGERPASCREFLVTSPAEKCAMPTNEEVRVVKRPFHVMSALARLGCDARQAKEIRWVPLVLALEWAGEHPDETAPRPGPELVRELFQHVADRENARLAIRPDPRTKGVP